MGEEIAALQVAESELPYAFPAGTGTEPHSFDLAHYRTRMAKYIDENKEENRVFFNALEFAHELHQGQRRKSGAPYISHPCAVAEILARELKFRDPLLLAAALLHDVVEDIATVTLEDIERLFGEVVAELVDGCTKFERRHLDRATVKDLTHSKIFLSASRRLGVLLIKLADRLHNLRTLHHLAKPNRHSIARETIDVYAPIAAKFNIYPLKRELYHLALSYLYPRKSKKILHYIQALRHTADYQQIVQTLQDVFAHASCPILLRPRAKGLGNYYDPQKRTLEVANSENSIDFAIILQTEELVPCYTALGIVCTTFSPIPRSLRDFIAHPKNSGYRSLHVRIHEGDQNYLIKVRTPSMDEWATYGILTDWSAQEPMSDEISDLLRTIGEYGGAGPQRKALIRLSQADEIYVFSPKGDTYPLPKGSIVLDFAYKIHSQLGDYCSGAVINGQWAPLTQPLKDGETVKILTSSLPLEVDPDLEKLCRTPRSRTAINRKLNQKRQQYAQQVGKEILLQEFRRHGLSEDIVEREDFRDLLEVIPAKDLEDLYTRLGQDLISPHLILYYLKPAFSAANQGQVEDAIGPHPSERNILAVSELDKAVHKFARCCNPYPGQDQVVAILSERGTTFHRRGCRDVVLKHDLQPQQLLDVVWNKEQPWRHPLSFHIQVSLETVHSLIPAIARAPSNVLIRHLESGVDRNDQPLVKLTVQLRDFAEAQRFFLCLPKNRVAIEDYGRDEGRGDPEPADRFLFE